MTTDLMLPENINPVAIFTGGLDDILEKIEREASAVATDMSTEQGRKEIASLAYKIARSKTFIDDAGKALGEDAKKKVDAINADRKKARDRLDALKDKVRRPLTDWENIEKQRVEEHEAHIIGLVQTANVSETADAIGARAQQIDALYSGRDWQEFSEVALGRYTASKKSLDDALANRRKYDAEQEELTKLRKAEADRIQREREEQLKAEAADNARKEAEAKASAEADAAERRAQADKDALERQKREAEQRAANAERKQQEAADKAEREKADAISKERARVEAAAKEEQQAVAKREADKKHRAKINNEVLKALSDAGLSEEDSQKAVEAIALGKVPHTKISY